MVNLFSKQANWLKVFDGRILPDTYEEQKEKSV
jgi:hypothetical protein